MTKREKRTEQITVARRKQILDASLKVFSRRGFGESTIADIAAEAGIGIGTIYNYYKNKRDLLISLVAENLITESLVKILTNVPPKSNEEFMESLLEERLDFGLDNAQKLLFLFFEIQRDSKLRRQYMTTVISPLVQTIEDYIRSQVESGNFRKVNEKVISRTIMGALIGNMILYRLELKNSPFRKSRIKDLSKELTSLYINGLKNI